jgi:adenine-specific DNA-methyltransferase
MELSPASRRMGLVTLISDLRTLLSAALQLGAEHVAGWSAREKQLVGDVPCLPLDVSDLRERVAAGEDPLGDAFCSIRSPEHRRPLGQTYTPAAVVTSMLEWAAEQGTPARVIDPGTGSARYLMRAGRLWPKVQLIGVDVDPVATIMARANLAASGLAERAHVELIDYRSLEPEPINGKTLFLGNPPYVRHHQIGPSWKRWLVQVAEMQGLAASQLAGLHVHFFLATAVWGRSGDFGSFITSAEWLDVNYGRLVRDLLLDGLGGRSVHVLEPTVRAFPDVDTTAAITCFRLGKRPDSVRLRQVKTVEDLGHLEGGREVSRERLAEASRWSPLVRVSPKLPADHVELGELCKVHRGQVTGANAVWVVGRACTRLPERVLFPSVTRARELFEAGERLSDVSSLRLVVDLPEDLDELDSDERKEVDRFLRKARREGASDGYIARSRKAWWRVGLRQPAPVLATYMARRPPAFVHNPAQARHINIAHGLYPREPINSVGLDRLVRHLRVSVEVGQGRTYAGGLTKFEPREMERLPVPRLEVLLGDDTGSST